MGGSEEGVGKEERIILRVHRFFNHAEICRVSAQATAEVVKSASDVEASHWASEFLT